MTRLALAQREHLAGELAARGIDCHTVIVADDENLDIAREHGCATVEMDNTDLGRRFNAGFRYAAQQGADYLGHIGSDDWAHPDLFAPLLEPTGAHRTKPIVTGRLIAIVDLASGMLRSCAARGPHGVIPWLIPRTLMVPCDFAPLPAGKQRGIDGHLVRGLHAARVKPTWRFHDPHELARVDFKSSVNITPFKALGGIARGTDRPAWEELAGRYPAELVEMARRTHEEGGG